MGAKPEKHTLVLQEREEELVHQLSLFTDGPTGATAVSPAVLCCNAPWECTNDDDEITNVSPELDRTPTTFLRYTLFFVLTYSSTRHKSIVPLQAFVHKFFIDLT